jgi:hypothetical protein
VGLCRSSWIINGANVCSVGWRGNLETAQPARIRLIGGIYNGKAAFRRLFNTYTAHAIGRALIRTQHFSQKRWRKWKHQKLERFFRDFKAQLFYPRTLDKRLFSSFFTQCIFAPESEPQQRLPASPPLNIPIQNLVQKYFLFNAFLIPSLSLYGKL